MATLSGSRHQGVTRVLAGGVLGCGVIFATAVFALKAPRGVVLTVVLPPLVVVAVTGRRAWEALSLAVLLAVLTTIAFLVWATFWPLLKADAGSSYCFPPPIFFIPVVLILAPTYFLTTGLILSLLLELRRRARARGFRMLRQHLRAQRPPHSGPYR